jgi:hypothetical protein
LAEIRGSLSACEHRRAFFEEGGDALTMVVGANRLALQSSLELELLGQSIR